MLFKHTAGYVCLYCSFLGRFSVIISKYFSYFIEIVQLVVLKW